MLKGSRQNQGSVFQSILRSNLFLFFSRTDQVTYSQDGYLGNVDKNFKFMCRLDTSLDLENVPFLNELTLNSSFTLCFLRNCEHQDCIKLPLLAQCLLAVGSRRGTSGYLRIK